MSNIHLLAVYQKVNRLVKSQYTICYATLTALLLMQGMASASISNHQPAPSALSSLSSTVPDQSSLTDNSVTSISIASTTSTLPHPDLYCTVVSISDGDTLTCLDENNAQIKVRLNQIDAPESGQAFGTVAKQALSDYVFGRRIAIRTSGTDKYGRTIGEIFLDGKNINKSMVADGMAWAYREYLTDPEYLILEADARNMAKGLWQQPNAIYPSEYRHPDRGFNVTTSVNAQLPSVESPSLEAPTLETQPVSTSVIINSPVPTHSESSSAPTEPVIRPTPSRTYPASTTPRPAPSRTSTPRPANHNFNFNDGRRVCGDMRSCAEARYKLNQCGLRRLDRDGDGVPCESLCR